MNKKGVNTNRILIAFVLIIIAYVAITLAAQAFPGGPTPLSGVSCSGLNKSTGVGCQGTYPGACGAAGDRIGCIDGINETFFMASNNDFASVNISYANTTTNDCGVIQQVFLCYRRSVRGGGSINNCDISIDNANWSSSFSVNSTCPSLNTQQPVICNNVTASETWSCNNFFGPSANGSTVARIQVQQSTGTSTRNLTVDALFFNVTYSADGTAPSIDFVSPTDVSGGYKLETSIIANVTASDSGSGVKNITIRVYNSTRALVNSTNSTTSRLFANLTVNSDGVYYFNATAYDNSGNANHTETRNVTIDRAAAVINFTNPTELNGGTITRSNILVNLSLSDVTPVNVTVNLFNSSNGLINQSNLTSSFSPSYFVNFTGLVNGTYRFNATVIDLLGNLNFTETRIVYVNRTPILNYLNATPNPIAGGNLITINATGVDDPQQATVQLFCHGTNTTPTVINTICTGGTTTVTSPPYNLNCTFTTPQIDANNTVYCRVYDGEAYSVTKSVNYTTKVSHIATSVVSVAGGTTQPYIDTANDARTDIIVSGETGMSCRWSSSDLAYSSMSNGCTTTNAQANCSVNDVGSQGFFTRYVSCADSVGNGQTSSDNLNVQFYLDYTAPTTSDNSDTTVRVPGYSVTLTESDNVDSDPKTTYCTDTVNSCIPGSSIDNGGQVTFSTRGVNYFRYNSTDFAGNKQSVQSKTININRLPVLTSASDNAVTIKGGTQVNITSIDYDLDSGQTLTLFVCNSTTVSATGCGLGNYCNATGNGNLTCVFNSETDSTSHSWFAYIYDSLNESASTDPISGSYTTDSTPPSITIIGPANASTTSTTVTLDIVLGESGGSAKYSLDNAANVTMSNISLFEWVSTVSSLAISGHNVTFYVNDSYGNNANVTRYFSVINAPDTIPPVIAVLSPGNASYISTSVLVNITADENLSWAGYTLNGGSLTSMSNTSRTSWNVTLVLSGESINNLTIFANDTSNNQANKSILFYFDNSAPRYSSNITLPRIANQSQSVNCSVSWTDTFNITSVLIGENSSGSFENHTISLSGTSGSASYLISGTRLANKGTYTCLFYATDIAGNTNSSSSLFVVNDVTPPIVTATSPTNATYSQQTIVASLVTNENASSAWYSLDGATNVTMSNSSITAWNATLSGLSASSHNIIFYANDSSNNVGASSQIFFSVVVTDNIPPVITVNTIANASYKTSTTVELNITGNENLVWAGYKLNSGSIITMSNSTAVNWNATLSGLTAESTNNLIVYANDTSNNQGNTTLVFYVDTIAPRFLNVSATPSTANESQSVVCNVYVNDTFSLNSVKIAENATIRGVMTNHTIDLTSAGYANYTINNVAKGVYSCVFFASDSAGNGNTTSTTFIVNDVTPPTVTATSPTNATYSQQTIVASLVTNENASSAWYSLDNAANTTMSGSAVSWSSTLSSLGNGGHSIIFYANDSSNNVGNSSLLWFSINVAAADTIPPVITVNTITNASYKTSTTVELNITTDENTTSAKYSLNGATNVSMSNSSMIAWNSILSGLTAESTNNLIIYANDTSNNTGIAYLTFYVDTLSPRYSNNLTLPRIANQSQSVNCSVSWTDTFNITSVLIGENSSGSFENHTISLSGTSGSTSYLISGARLSNKGTYTCLFYATDIAGNTNSSSSLFIVNDVTPPTVTATSPTNATYTQQSIVASIVTSENASSAWYSLDGNTNVTMSNTSLTNWNATLSGLSASSHNIIFYANDSSNNVGASSQIFFSVVVTDNISPVITVNTITNASYKTSTTVELNITGNENLVWAGYKLNSGSIITMSNSTAVNWNATLSGLTAESTNNLIVYANDTSNNQGNTTLVFYVDTIAPRFLNVSATPSTANESQSVVCNVYVNDTFSLSSVKIEENASIQGVMTNHTIDLTSRGYANYTITNVKKGDYQCLFYAIDIAGNTNVSMANFTVNDVIAPVITINSPSNVTYSTNSILLSISLNENASSASYSLDGSANVSLTGSATSWSDTLNIDNGNHNIIFYAVDGSSNVGNSSIVSFIVDTTVYDTTAPIITVLNPANNSYFTSSSVLFNITMDKNISWAGYSLNGAALVTLDNTSLTSWNSTLTLAEGQYNLTFYANDTTSHRNQGNKSSEFYVDLNDPGLTLICPTEKNDSLNVSCFITASDTIGLDYSILSYNATGSWQNVTLTMSGQSSTVNYNISSSSTRMPGFSVFAYTHDLSGRISFDSRNVSILDDSFPEIYNISYYPNITDALDPGIRVDVNASIVDNYNVSSVYLMWLNQSDGNWINVLMTNLTRINYTGFTNTVFNASFIPQNGTYYFKINVTDSTGNQNISVNTTIGVTNDTSYFNSTNIPEIKSITYAQETSNNTLGQLYVNNTGDDSQLNFTINISSSIRDRFNINLTSNPNATYSLGAGEAVNLTLFVDTTSLSAGLYDYNITVSSSAGTSVIQKKLNIQTAEGPYLSVSIDSYSSSVTRGQTGVTLSASVTNLGTEAAQSADLNWTLPSEFSLVSGNISRAFSVLPVGLSSSNTITIDVSNSSNVSSVNIVAIASAANANSSNATKSVAITNPLTITSTVTNTVTVNTGGGGGVSGGGGGAAVVISKTIEVTRGEQMEFNVNVFNKYPNKTLDGLTLTILGFPEKYISIYPKSIDRVQYNQSIPFRITLSAPTYKSREEHLIQAIIRGRLVEDKTSSDYSETQNIKLIIQEVSTDESSSILDLAKKAIEQMKEKAFNIIGVDKLYELARQSLEKRDNSQVKRLADEIVLTKNTAFAAFDLIDRLKKAMDNPRLMYLITSNVPSEFIDQNGNVKTSQSLLTGNVVFAGQSVTELVGLAQAAFDRGDYPTALERAKNAQVMLILERKGNFGLFLYLYWYYVFAGIILIAGFGMYALRSYRRANISGKISDLEREEQNIRFLMIGNQKAYLSGKISSADYHKTLSQHTKRLADIQKERINLREKRIRLLPRSEVNIALEKESAKLEEQIKSLQRKFYVEHKVPESEYHTQFAAFNEQMTEIEGEKVELTLREKAESKEEVKPAVHEKHDAGKRSIFDFVKRHFKENDLKGKYIKINVKEKEEKHGGDKK